MEQVGTLRVWRPAEMPCLEFSEGRDFGHSYPRHWHDVLFITAITGGTGDFFFRGENHRATPGTLVVIPAGEVHTHDSPARGRSFRCVHLPAGLPREFDPGAPLTDLPPTISRGPLFHAFLSLHRTFEGLATHLQREAQLTGFFGALVHSSPKYRPLPQDEPALVRRTEEFLNDCYNREISLKELAALADLSPYHFHRIFSRHKGMPPHAYQIQIRIFRAKQMLKQRLPIAHIAAAAGFADQSHFTRHFKRIVGFTPAQYSKNVLDA